MSCSQRAAAPMASHAHSALGRAASQSSLLQSLTPADVAELADVCEVRTFQRGEVLMCASRHGFGGSSAAACRRQYRKASEFARPVAGRRPAGPELGMAAHGRGSVVGDAHSLAAATAHVEAMVDGVLAVVAFADLESLCDEQLRRASATLAECAMGRLPTTSAGATLPDPLSSPSRAARAALERSELELADEQVSASAAEANHHEHAATARLGSSRIT